MAFFAVESVLLSPMTSSVTSASAATAAAFSTRDSSVTSHGMLYGPTGCVCGVSATCLLQPPLPVCPQEQPGVPPRQAPRSYSTEKALPDALAASACPPKAPARLTASK